MKDFIPHWLKDNFRIKIGLFCLAILLWFLVITEKTYEHVAEIPIIPTHVKSGRMITNRIPKIALVKFRATGKEMLKLLFFSKPNLQINLSTINSNYVFDINPDMVSIPGGVIVTATEVVYPDSLEFLLDEIYEIEIPVTSNIYVKTSAGYTMTGDIILNPQTVKVVGPKSKLKSLKMIESDSTSLMDAKRNTIINLKLKDLGILGSKIIPSHVEALVNIEKIGEQKIKGVLVTVQNKPDNRDIILEPGSVDVALSGAISIISALVAEDIVATANYLKYNPRKSSRVQVKASTKANADIVEVFPKEVRMIVRRK